MTGALAGIRVIECGHFIAGPRTSQLLADQGADVIKVEPLSGDPSRRADPLHNGHSLYFYSHNRGKRSIALNLKTEEGKAVFTRLIEGADVFLSNYAPGAIASLGLDHASLAAINPRIVTAYITAYGLDSSMGDTGGVDGTVQSISGIADMIGASDGPPTVTSIPILDHLVAVDTAYAVSLGLRHRDATGVGESIDVSMLDVAMSILAYAYGDVLQRGEVPHRDGSRAPYSFTTIYRASDGYVFIAPVRDEMFAVLSGVVGHPEWGEPESPYMTSANRLRDRNILEPQIEEWTGLRTRAEVVETVRAAGIACAPVLKIDEAIRSDIAGERGMVGWVTSGGDPDDLVAVPGPELKFASADRDPVTANVPDLAGDTDDVLAALGYTDHEVARLRSLGVIAPAA